MLGNAESDKQENNGMVRNKELDEGNNGAIRNKELDEQGNTGMIRNKESEEQGNTGLEVFVKKQGHAGKC